MEIELRKYLKLMRKHLWLVVWCVFIPTVLTAVYSYYNYQPIYQASTKLIVNKTHEQIGREEMDFGAIGINIKMIDTYKEIIKTPAIMDKVVQRYPDLHMSTEQLIASINVSGINDTQVMSIVARAFSYEKAVRIANAVSAVFQTEIAKIMKVDNIAVLNAAEMKNDPQPVNQHSKSYIMLSFLVSLIVIVGLILLKDSFDDTLKTEEDIRLVLETSTLALTSKIEEKELRSARKIKAKQRGKAPYASTNP